MGSHEPWRWGGDTRNIDAGTVISACIALVQSGGSTVKTCWRMGCLVMTMIVLATATVASCAKVDQGGGASTGGNAASASPTGGASVVGVPDGSAVTGTGGDVRGVTGAGGMSGEKMCGIVSFPLARKLGDVVVVLDRSASMQKNSLDQTPTGPTDPTKWAQLVPALTSVISMAGTDISWGLKSFPEDGSECASATVTSKMDLSVSTKNFAALNLAIMTTLPNGNGTPTGAAVGVAADYLNALGDGNKHYLLLATDGQPSCGGTAGALVGNTNKQAQTDAVAAVKAAADSGIHTFVVGVATKASDEATLNLLANAGLEARSDPNPLATKYYLGTTNAELIAALQAITGVVNKDCLFPLGRVPPVPENIAVKVMGVKAPFDSSNTTGWNYADPMTVQVFGAWCDMIKNEAADMVQIFFGCPNVEIP